MTHTSFCEPELHIIAMDKSNATHTRIVREVLDLAGNDSAALSELEVIKKHLGLLVETLSGRDRKARQASAHAIATLAKTDPETVLPYVDGLVDAIERPEAQTRWECLDALTSLAAIDPQAASKAFEGAEAALFDEESGLLRFVAFRYFSKLAENPEFCLRCWPLLDEALQCYHGDSEFAGMLDACVELAQADLDPSVLKALSDRMKFDAESGKGPLSYRAKQIMELCAR